MARSCVLAADRAARPDRRLDPLHLAWLVVRKLRHQGDAVLKHKRRSPRVCTQPPAARLRAQFARHGRPPAPALHVFGNNLTKQPVGLLARLVLPALPAEPAPGVWRGRVARAREGAGPQRAVRLEAEPVVLDFLFGRDDPAERAGGRRTRDLGMRKRLPAGHRVARACVPRVALGHPWPRLAARMGCRRLLRPLLRHRPPVRYSELCLGPLARAGHFVCGQGVELFGFRHDELARQDAAPVRFFRRCHSSKQCFVIGASCRHFDPGRSPGWPV